MEQRKRLPLWASQYLQRLGLEERPASYAYLAELCRAHLQTIPYENVSKLLWYHERKRNSSAIPSVETFVENALHFDCGGTCYTSNSSLQLLLQALGFTSHLVALEPDHMGIIVEVSEWNGEKVYVDVGAAAPLFQPVRFQTDPDNCAVFGIEEVRIASDREHPGRYRFVRRRRGELVSDKWHFHPDEKRFLPDFSDVMDRSNQPGATFMSCLRIHLWQPNQGRSVSLLNNSLLIRGKDGSEQQRQLSTLEDVEQAVTREFGLPRLPVRDAVRVLEELGVDIFAPETAP